jgi:hypothetical protein
MNEETKCIPEMQNKINLPNGMIYMQMKKIMTDISFIGKDQTNLQQKFKYRGIDDVYGALHSIMANHGVFTTSRILHQESFEKDSKSGGKLIHRIIHFEYRFYTIDGSFVSTEVIGEAMDSGDKAANKAIAIAHKYALLQAFIIPTEEQKDPDAEAHEIVRKIQQKTPTFRLDDDKVPADNVCPKCNSIMEISTRTGKFACRTCWENAKKANGNV